MSGSLMRAISRIVLLAALVSFSAVSFFTPAVVAEDKKSAAKEEKRSKKKKKSTKKQAAKKEEFDSPAVNDGFTSSELDSELVQDGAGVDAVILMDSSRSMERTDPGRLRDQAAKLFLRFLDEKDRVAVIQFDKEMKTVIDFTAIDPNNLGNLDQAIQQIPTEGGFTDIELPIEHAYRLLTEKGRPGVGKCVILLSDGKLDPHPTRGTSDELRTRLFAVDLPSYRKAEIKLYTVAFSEEADRTLLGDIAKDGGGLSWFAPDADTIHLKFSDLFLALKKPQVLPLDKKGFVVDNSVQEATFYISKKEPQLEVTLISPKGEQLNSKTLGTGIKWYKGEMFDIVTIRKPAPGSWIVSGVDEASGFATLLTEVKLQARWPESHVIVGSSVVLSARLINEGKVVEEEGLRDVTFFSYRIISGSSGTLFAQGPLNDEGKEGDAKAKDSIYSATIKLDKEGEFKALVGVTTPTFTRQQQIPFSVSKGMITLSVEPEDSFAGTKERFRAVLGPEAVALNDLAVVISAIKEGEEPLLLKMNEVSDEVYELETAKLPAGQYKVSAKLKGVNKKKKEAVKGSSDTIDFTARETAAPSAEHQEDDVDIEIESEGEPEGESIMLPLLSLLFAFIGAGGMAFGVLKKIDLGKGMPEREAAYERPEELINKLNELKSKASSERRKPNAEDVVVFDLIKEIYGKGGDDAEEGGGSSSAPEGGE